MNIIEISDKIQSSFNNDQHYPQAIYTSQSCEMFWVYSFN
jgi:hypothetical protein